MKRDKIIDPNEIPETVAVQWFFPIFDWHECNKCGKECRFEFVRVVYDDKWTQRIMGAVIRHRKYYCKLCTSSHYEAFSEYDKYFNRYMERVRKHLRGNPPPTPPKPYRVKND